MVISVLAGGLGNQLFQYAFGFRLARQLQTDLRLERHLLESRTLARLRNYTPRQYELNVFGIEQMDASLSDTLRCLSRTLLPGHQAVLLRESDPTSLHTLTQPTARTQHALCFGYWQSEVYFKPEADALRKQLVFQKCPSDKTLRVAEIIRSGQNATFVHIRRGDYVTNANANQHHGVCDEAYYHHSVAYLRERVSDAHFFVFSDDQNWVKRELGALLGPATFVEHNTGADSWQDMYLMRLCRHAIVANSSFSWWGAWLNSQTNRIVVAPQRWFAADKSVYPAVVPPDWILI
ncbi:alpha-1,2-fucosyltransferase [Spirosoma areae]